MLIHVPDVLTPDEVAKCRALMDRAAWDDGKLTAGDQSAVVKDNHQVRYGTPEQKELVELVLMALGRSPLFITASLALKIFPPMFSRYHPGQSFGTHVDNAIRNVPNTPHRVRTDVSATLFLAAPEEYDGGELVIEDVYAAQRVKLPAGHLILYPTSSVHHVRAVTRGTRLAAVFWAQSMVRDDGQRTILFDLDTAIRNLRSSTADQNPAIVQLTAIYHNLLRRWADV